MPVTSEPSVDVAATRATLTVVDGDTVVHTDPEAVVVAARAEAERIVAEAKRDAFEIYRSASADAQSLLDDARAEAAEILERARAEVGSPAAPVAPPTPEASPVPVPEAVPATDEPASVYDVVSEPEPEAPSPFEEPVAASRYAKHAAEIPRLGEDAGREAVAVATSLRGLLRK